MHPVPSNSPIYGGKNLNLEIDVGDFNFTPDELIHSKFYLVYVGSKERRVTYATPTYINNCLILQSTIPGHNELESVQLSAYIYHSNKYRLLASCQFDYISDSIYQISKFLLDGVDNENRWKKVEKLCEEYLNLASVLHSDLDLYLTAALKSLHLPTSWSYSRNNISDYPEPNETLLHFAACLGLEKLAIYLLSKPGSYASLQLINHNGFLPEEIAYNKGFYELATILRKYRKGSKQICDKLKIEDENVSYPVVSCCLSWSNRDIEYDIGELDRLILNQKNAVRMSGSFRQSDVTIENEQNNQHITSVTDQCYKIIPSISITAHSPKRKSMVLEDNLRRLQDIHEGIQKLRELNKKQIILQGWHKEGRARLSASCPSLPLVTGRTENGANNEKFCKEQKVEASDRTAFNLLQRKRSFSSNATVIRPEVYEDKIIDNTIKIRVNDLTPSNSQEFLNSSVGTWDSEKQKISILQVDTFSKNQGSHIGGTSAQRCARKTVHKELVRRQSWSHLLPNTKNDNEQEKLHIHKSWSLSSLDSDVEDTFYDARDLPASPIHISQSSSVTSGKDISNVEFLKEKQRSFSAGSREDIFCTRVNDLSNATVHSLTDINAEIHSYIEDETNSSDTVTSDSNAWLMAPRTPLQKSVSTPSILVAQEMHEKDQRESRDSLFNSQSFQLRETDDDDSNLVLEDDEETDQMPNIYLGHVSLAGLIRDHGSGVQDSDDEKPTFGKRKKRGSLFFRKKRGKDKEKDGKRTSHQFVSICYSTAALCDVCNKPLAKKLALKCESCLVTVHESSCKDQILDCGKFKKPKVPLKASASALAKDQENPRLQVPPGRTPYYPYRYHHLLGPVPQNVVANTKQNTSNQMLKEMKPGSVSVNRLQPQFILGSSNSVSIETSSNKFGSSHSSKVICEEKECEQIEDINSSNIIDINSASMESLDEGAQEISDLEDDPLHRIMEDEPEVWSNTADKKILKKLKEKEIKRQEVIYELILTEKHHCLTLKIMQKIYAHGMIKELNMSKDLVERILPNIEELLEVHLHFLSKLRERQQKGIVVECIGDILVQQFQGETAEQMKSAYGHFCSQHKDAVSLYKDILKSDRKFQNFIKKCSSKPLFKSRLIPECILLVTQRLTKYPLLIERLTKATKDSKKEYDNLIQARNLITEVIKDVDAQVAEKEKEQRLLEIYNKIDAKSTAFYKGKKFKKSDLLSHNRKLLHEGPLSWKVGTKGKTLEVIGVVLSDVVLFVQENNQKYYFASLENKSGILSLQKLLIRDKAGQDNRVIYLISSNPSEPEMFEIQFPSCKDKKVWIAKIWKAVENCANEDEGVTGETEEMQKLEEAKSAKLKELIGLLHDQDVGVALLCEKKMKILIEILELLGIESDSYENVQYTHLVETKEGENTKELMMAALNNASCLASSLYASGTNLSRSVSSAGEHQSETFISPQLPKRAETFGGFDNPNKEQTNNSNKGVKKKLQHIKDQAGLNTSSLSLSTKTESDSESADFPQSKVGVDAQWQSNSSISKSRAESPDTQSLSEGSVTGKEFLRLTTTPLLVTQGKEQLEEIVELTHQINTLRCLLDHHFSGVESLRVQLVEANERIAKLKDEKTPREKRERRSVSFRPEQQLEELRNLQENLSQSKLQWQKEKIEELAEINKRKTELERMQEQIKSDQADLNHQRELLYRKLEALQKEGIILSPQHTVVNLGSICAKEESAISSNTDLDFSNDDVPQHRRSISFDLQKVQGPVEMVSNRTSWTMPSSGESRHHHDPRFQSTHSTSSLPAINKRESIRDSVPFHLCSATNMKKRQVSNVKQQLPLKLASGNTALNGLIENSSLPLKLVPDNSNLPPGEKQTNDNNEKVEQQISGIPVSPKSSERKTSCGGITVTIGTGEAVSSTSKSTENIISRPLQIVPSDKKKQEQDPNQEIFC